MCISVKFKSPKQPMYVHENDTLKRNAQNTCSFEVMTKHKVIYNKNRGNYALGSSSQYAVIVAFIYSSNTRICSSLQKILNKTAINTFSCRIKRIDKRRYSLRQTTSNLTNILSPWKACSYKQN